MLLIQVIQKQKLQFLDANITTLIAAIILFAFGSGPVKGFAITLGIGIITTLFTAYFLARHLTSMIVLKKKKKLRFNKYKNIDFSQNLN